MLTPGEHHFLAELDKAVAAISGRLFRYNDLRILGTIRSQNWKSAVDVAAEAQFYMYAPKTIATLRTIVRRLVEMSDDRRRQEIT